MECIGLIFSGVISIEAHMFIANDLPCSRLYMMSVNSVRILARTTEGRTASDAKPRM